MLSSLAAYIKFVYGKFTRQSLYTCTKPKSQVFHIREHATDTPVQPVIKSPTLSFRIRNTNGIKNHLAAPDSKVSRRTTRDTQKVGSVMYSSSCSYQPAQKSVYCMSIADGCNETLPDAVVYQKPKKRKGHGCNKGKKSDVEEVKNLAENESWLRSMYVCTRTNNRYVCMYIGICGTSKMESGGSGRYERGSAIAANRPLFLSFRLPPSLRPSTSTYHPLITSPTIVQSLSTPLLN